MDTVTGARRCGARFAADYPLLRKAARLCSLSSQETDYLAGLHQDLRSYAPHEELCRKGEILPWAYIICAGWAICYDLHPDGRRQIVAHLLPGDMAGFYLNFDEMADSHIESQTKLDVAVLDRSRVARLHEEMPRLGAALAWLHQRDAWILAEQVVRLGRRSAYERMADFLLETWLRLKLIGEAADHNFKLPLTQGDLADTLGLSTVHVNRTLQRLRADGLISLADGRVMLLDAQRLKKVANYEQFFVDRFVV